MVNHTVHAMNATLCPVSRSDASRVGSQLDASKTVAVEGFDIGASLDIVSSTLMAKWRHKSRVYVRYVATWSPGGSGEERTGVRPRK
jgi:hypothetical protein